MASIFSWLDYDESERNQFDGLLRALEDVETVDNLGVGPIRDGIANLLFPGTSTIQTRARYFLLAARDCIKVEQSRPSTSAEFAARLRREEIRTLEALKVHGSANEGIIGFRRGAKTKRLPVSVYWNGAGEWGLRRHPGRSLVEYQAATVAACRRDQQYGEEPGEAGDASWWEELPAEIDDRDTHGLAITPTYDEAEYLLERAAGTAAGGAASPWGPGARSLLAVVARHVQDTPSTSLPEYVFEIKDSFQIEPRLATLLRHAGLFSSVVQGVRLLYLRLLYDAAQALGSKLDDETLRDDENSWLEECDDLQNELTTWITEAPELFEILRGAGTRIPEASREFFLQWIRAAVRDPQAAYGDPAQRDAVRRREIAIKRSNARLSRAADLTRYDGALYGGAYLDYRWSTTRRLLEDCRVALGGSDAGA